MNNASFLHASIILASAFTTATALADGGMIGHLNNHFEGAIGAEHLGYRETSSAETPPIPPGNQLDTESGTLLASGLSASWQGKLWIVDDFRAILDVNLGSGHANYNGYLVDLQSGALTPYQDATHETFTDVQFKVGKGFRLLPGSRDLLTPYAGLGLTAWHRDLGGGQTEQYRHRFWKIGGQYQVEVARNLAVNLDASYGHMFDARMNASDVPPTFDLGSTSVQDYRLGLRYRTSPEAYVGMDAFWMHYGYNQSPVYEVTLAGQSGTVLEPSSRTTRDGLLVVFGYAYR